MKKSRIWLFSICSAILIAVVYFFVTNSYRTKKYEGIPAANAIPAHSPVVLLVDGLDKLKESLTQTEIWNELNGIGAIKRLDDQIEYLDKEILSVDAIQRILNNRKIVISLNLTGKNDFEYLFLTTLTSDVELGHINDLIKKLSQKNQWQVTKRKYSNKIIFDIFRKGKRQFSYSVSRGVLLLSASPLLVEDGIRQLELGIVFDNSSFKQLYEIAGDDSNLSLFVNHKDFPELLKLYLGRKQRKNINQLSDYAEWTGIDVDFRKGRVMLNGFSMISDSLTNYLQLFKNQRQIRTQIDHVLPSQTMMYIRYGLSSFEEFQKDYQNYLHGSSPYFKRLNCFKNFEAKTKYEALEFFNKIVANEVAVALTSFDKKQPAANAFMVLEVQSQSEAENMIVECLKKLKQKNDKRTLGSYISTYRVDNELAFKIFEFPFKDIPKSLMGGTFDLVQAKYATFFDNYLILGNSVKALSSFLYSNVLNETLGRDSRYLQYADELPTKGNITTYLNVSRGLSLASHILNPELNEVVQKHKNSVRKLKAFMWQLGYENNMIFNYATLNYNPAIKEEPQAIWSQNLQKRIDFKPVFVKNHRQPNNKEVMVQDNDNVLYLINNQGRVLWKQKLDSKIKGQIHQIDYYKNNKLQYLFNTAKKIYLIDRNGNPVAKYPINLRSEATSGLALFDYDKNRKYRIAVACENKKMYLYQKEGKIVAGWKFDKTESEVKHPAMHLRISGKDYIVFADKNKVYITNRQGTIRVKTNADSKLSDNPIYFDKATSKHSHRLIYTDEKGTIYYQYFDGKKQKLNVGKKNDSHLFNIADLNNDGESDFIFADDEKLLCLKNNGKKLFHHMFNDSELSNVNIYKFSSSNIKIGVTDADNDKIFLFNSDGTIFQGFPLRGCSGFSIGLLSKKDKDFNLIVGNSEGYLKNYLVN